MEFFRKIKRSVLLLLFPALLLLMGNAAFNWHIHQMADGSKVVHAHPYQTSGNPDQPVPSHKHSSSEYAGIQQLTGFIFIVAQAILLALLLGVFIQKVFSYSYRVKLSSQILLLPNRAPPALS
ncbi:MAG: hypothetical protein ACEPOZ_15755 [Marinifilaceae bacterium]|jgi:hypothetical protein